MAKVYVMSLLWSFWILFIHTEVVKRSACQVNEMFAECAHCGPKTCDDLGYPIPCGGGTSLCNPECVCIDGYVRDANGTCIPKVECSACGGDVNAMTGCGNHCGNSCSDYKDVNKTCFSGCRYNSCDCKPGHVYHEKANKWNGNLKWQRAACSADNHSRIIIRNRATQCWKAAHHQQKTVRRK